jgi:hypothetical protein
MFHFSSLKILLKFPAELYFKVHKYKKLYDSEIYTTIQAVNIDLLLTGPEPMGRKLFYKS